MPDIHPTAIIDQRVTLADGVSVGPYCVVSGDVTIGTGTRLIGHVHVKGPTVLGRENVLYPFVCVGYEPQDLKYAGQTAGVVVGDRNQLREGAVVHCSTSADQPTTVGDDCFLMTNSHVGHDSLLHNHVTLVTGAVLGGHAVLHDNTFVGGNAGVHQFCRMGRMSFMGGGGASISKDLPPFCMADYKNAVTGLNLVGLRRAGVPRPAIDRLRAAFKLFFASGHTVPNALQKIDAMIAENGEGDDLLREFVEFVRASKKGIVPYVRGRKQER